MNWLAIAETPELALPAVLLAGSFVAWAVWNVRDPPVGIVRPTPRAIPNRDPISRAFHAFESGQFTEVLSRARARLDRTSVERFGRPVSRLPGTRWGARRFSPSHVSQVVSIRRLGRTIESMHDVAARRESGIWLRLDFWRSHAELRARFRTRLVPVLDQVSRVSAGGSA
jgi:hypothetical protein